MISLQTIYVDTQGKVSKNCYGMALVLTTKLQITNGTTKGFKLLYHYIYFFKLYI